MKFLELLLSLFAIGKSTGPELFLDQWTALVFYQSVKAFQVYHVTHLLNWKHHL